MRTRMMITTIQMILTMKMFPTTMQRIESQEDLWELMRCPKDQGLTTRVTGVRRR
jgi:hypothetical protein